MSLGWSGKDGEFSARRVGITKLQLLAGNNVTSSVLSVRRRKWRGGQQRQGHPFQGDAAPFIASAVVPITSADVSSSCPRSHQSTSVFQIPDMTKSICKPRTSSFGLSNEELISAIPVRWPEKGAASVLCCSQPGNQQPGERAATFLTFFLLLELLRAALGKKQRVTCLLAPALGPS